MSAPRLRISDGVLVMDGGSVFLDATDDSGRCRRIHLDWSIARQQQRRTGLRVDGIPLPAGSQEEQAWIQAIASAEIVPKPAPSVGEKIGARPLMLAKDAEAVWAAGERSPTAGLTALRDSLLEKLRSPVHVSTNPPCPQCGSTQVKFIDGAVWTFDCLQCGFSRTGTAHFGPRGGIVEVEKDYRVVFQLSTVKQIPLVRSIAPELSGLSTREILNTARADGLKLAVSPLSMSKAREYAQRAAIAGIEAAIQGHNEEPKTSGRDV